MKSVAALTMKKYANFDFIQRCSLRIPKYRNLRLIYVDSEQKCRRLHSCAGQMRHPFVKDDTGEYPRPAKDGQGLLLAVTSAVIIVCISIVDRLIRPWCWKDLAAASVEIWKTADELRNCLQARREGQAIIVVVSYQQRIFEFLCKFFWVWPVWP